MLRCHLVTEYSCRSLNWQAVKEICLRILILTSIWKELLPERYARDAGIPWLWSSENLPALQDTLGRLMNDCGSVQEKPLPLALATRSHSHIGRWDPARLTGYSRRCLGDEEPVERWSALPKLLMLSPGWLWGRPLPQFPPPVFYLWPDWQFPPEAGQLGSWAAK